MTERHVFLLGANDRAAATVSRQLARAGHRVGVADWTAHPIRFSRFVDGFHRLADPELDVESCVEDLARTLEREDYEFLIPMNDAALELCYTAETLLSRRTQVLGINGPDSRNFSRDKSVLYEACRAIGFPLPESRRVATLDELSKLLPELRYPLMARPVSSKVIHRNRLYSFKPKMIHDEIQLVDFLRENIASVPFMLQAPLKGHGAGYNVLAREGSILVAYAHRRIHEAWGGGASTYRGTIPLDTYAEFSLVPALIKRMGWNGVAMLEFLVSGGRAYPIEMNGRFWGSIELGVFGGCDMPSEFFAEFGEGRGVHQRTERRQPVYARNLKWDLILLVTGLAQGQSPSLLLDWAKSFSNLFQGREIIEDNPLKDPAFRLAEYALLGQRLLVRLRLELMGRVMRVGQRPQGLAGTRSAAFVCPGNICRSPFAEAYARKRLPNREFSSFGVHAQEDRLSPCYALSASADHGVSLAEHRSRALTLELSEKFDAIFVSDRKTAWYICRKGLAPRAKVFLIDGNDIPDPKGHDLPSFRSVYARIARAIDRMAEGS